MKKADLHVVNGIISRAFTQGRIDDGYAYTQVPMCRPDFLEMYFAQCPQGCFVVEDAGQIRGASFCHIWGETGWIGPLAIAPEKHHLGMGKMLATRATEFLKEFGCKTIGLETNPRSNRNLGFYGKMGYVVSALALDMIRAVPTIFPNVGELPHKTIYYSALPDSERQEFIHQAKKLTRAVSPSLDYTNLIQAMEGYRQGDTALFMRMGTPIGLAVLQTEPSLVEEQNAMLRIVTFVAHPKTPDAYLPYFLSDMLKFAKAKSLDRILIRLPMYSSRAFQILLNNNYRVVNSDLRMTLDGYRENSNKLSFHFNRWV